MTTNLIEKLNSKNYSTWSADIKFLLLEKGVWHLIENEEVTPEVSTTVTREAVDAFKIKSNQAMSLIYLNIEPEFKRLIEDCREPIHAWKKLRMNFHPDTRAHHMSLFSEMMECKIKTGETINMFAARLKKIYLDIKLIDNNLSEDYVCYQFLRYLPTTYDHAVQFLLNCPKDKFKFNLIAEEMVSEETRQKLREKDVTANLNWSSNTTKTRKKYRRPSSKVRKCWTCGDPRHLQASCPDRRKQRRRTSRSRKPSPSTSESSGSLRRDSPGRSHGYSRGRQRWSSSRSPSYSPGRRDGQFRKKKYSSPSTDDDSSRKSIYYVSNCNVSSGTKDSDWIFDTGASHHFCNDRSLFTKFKEVKDDMSVAAKGARFPIQGRGEVKLKFGQRTFTVCDVLYSDSLRKNLLSGVQLDKKGLKFVGSQGEVKIFRNTQYLFSAYLKNRAYFLYPKIPKPSDEKNVTFENLSTTKNENMLKWHRRMGHVSQSIIAHTSRKNGARGLPSLKEGELNCESCKLGKFRSVSHKYSKEIRSKRPLELMYADLWGPCNTEGRNGERYFLSIIDDYSRRVSVYPLRLKSETPDVIKRHITRAENYLGKKVKAIRTDNGREFVNSSLKEYYDAKGINHELTNVYTPQMNGTAERFMQTAADGIRTILIESNMDASFWPEALKYYVYTWNRVCPKLLTKTPFELYGGKKPSVRHLKPFGITAYVGIPRQRRNKLDAKARKGYLVGYAFNTRGYRVWSPDNNEITESSNVRFDEDQCGPKRSGAVLGTEDYSLFSPVADRRRECIVETEPESIPGPSNATQTSQSESEGESDSGSSKKTPTAITPLREVSWIRKTKKSSSGDRNYVYYFEEGKTLRLRTLNNIRDYCKNHNIVFKPELFDFSGKNRYRGIVPIPESESESESDTDSVTSSHVHPRA